MFRSLGMSPERLADDIAEAATEHGPWSLPTILVGVTDGILAFSTSGGAWTLDVDSDSAAVFIRAPKPFVTLVQTLRAFIRLGRTCQVGAFDHYFHADGELRGDVAAHRPLTR